MATTNELLCLATDGEFRQRVRGLALFYARTVMAENVNVPGHNTRFQYAASIIAQPTKADQITDFIVGGAAMTASTVTYDFDRRAVVSNVTDNNLLGQITNDWNMLAGVQV